MIVLSKKAIEIMFSIEDCSQGLFSLHFGDYLVSSVAC